MIESKKLKDISLSIGSGITPRRDNKSYWENGTIPWLKTEQLGEKNIYDTNEKISQIALDETSIKLFPVNTLSMAMYGEGRTRGNVSILKKAMTTNQACCNIVIDSKKADYEFVYYYLKTQYEQLRGLSSGVRKNLNSNDIKEYEIRLPSDLSTQQKIAAVLSTLDAKIELNARINAELESMAKTLYDYWFVQFAPHKSAGGKVVWNDALKREIPLGWEVKKLGDVLKTYLGGTPSTKNPEYWENATIPWLNSGDLTEFPIIKSSSFVTQKGVDNSATTILPKGSVVISLVRYIRPSIIALEACANQSVVGIRETEELKNSFIYPYLVNEVPRLMSLRTGAQQPHINKETIDDSPICIPPANVLKEYYKVSEPIYKKIINVAFESQTLTELRDWLLPMLMNGQVTIQTSEV